MFDILFDDFIYFCLGPGIVCDLRVWGFDVHSVGDFGLTNGRRGGFQRRMNPQRASKISGYTKMSEDV